MTEDQRQQIFGLETEKDEVLAELQNLRQTEQELVQRVVYTQREVEVLVSQLDVLKDQFDKVRAEDGRMRPEMKKREEALKEVIGGLRKLNLDHREKVGQIFKYYVLYYVKITEVYGTRNSVC